jgi:hypothetical protein
MTHYVDINNKALSAITGYQIKEYSSPCGVHPQPTLTSFLEKEGFVAYYYLGDLGSAPNRTFHNGAMVSDQVIAFPVMPMGEIASIKEIAENEIAPEIYEKWLFQNLDNVMNNKEICLIYNHIYDFKANPQYIKPFKNFTNKIIEYHSKDKLIANTMTYFAEFILRYLKTDYQFFINDIDQTMIVNLNNPEGLDGITVAIPKNNYQEPTGNGFYVEEDTKYYYVIITEKIFEKSLICPLIADKLTGEKPYNYMH